MSEPKPKFEVEESGVIEALDAQERSLATTLGKYRLIGGLGHGGMADVYLAVADGPEGFRKLCVLKMLKEDMADDEEFRAMFLDEARLAARLSHPNIVQTFESGEIQGRLTMVMEYVEGQPIHRLQRRLTKEQFPLAANVSVICDVLAALDYAHGLTDFDGSNLGIVHRDVSPHNVIVGYDGRVKLLDFGIAKSSAAMQMTQAGVLKGKIGYMAPEQASMLDLDGRADVFSVGVILWEAIAGRRLAEGLNARQALVRRIEGTDPKIAEVVPDVDPELAALCDRAMCRDPNERFGSAAEFQTELERWLSKRGAPSRKLWASALRDAYTPEREQLRALVEQRLANTGTQPTLRALTSNLRSHSRDSSY
ncbi:MAG TPA: serine/threonine-protein kinase, partial [Labilithrix sp.]|nr:serine/threonine-protein kinase [Labilithrix sp.]